MYLLHFLSSRNIRLPGRLQIHATEMPVRGQWARAFTHTFAESPTRKRLIVLVGPGTVPSLALKNKTKNQFHLMLDFDGEV